ncbi:hypothetical protein JDV09_23280 [Mycobacterium sp. Y57]|uniref:hypothetical protein n=1 Tax=Mycolicibacterium xanthum TaxID=2796469 RepID=UPI001C85BAFC|nr:hypothetical protein [Mycolicibacterium xanthum]MBX7434995.1 hypothetical protein [Mycolicibacterium xanthum]
MPSFRRRSSVIDDDQVDESPRDTDRAAEADRARALAEEAEAEAAEAEATAAAARARARAIRLRREADNAAEPAADETSPTPADEVAAEPGVQTEAEPATEDEDVQDADRAAADTVDSPGAAADTVDSPGDAEATDDLQPARSRRLRRPGWRSAVAAACVLGIVALLSLSGYLFYSHRQAQHLHQQNAEYAAAAKQAVVTLMSLDFNNAEADVARIIDNSTGPFRDDFQGAAKDFVKIAQESKVVTDVTVNAAAVQSMTDDSAEVLVAATSKVSNTSGAEQQPRTWRLAVSLQREGDQIKMSKLEFVP